jgi:H+/Na+-translocating ferredoxin:NAD+ oxidoreductase subunit C
VSVMSTFGLHTFGRGGIHPEPHKEATSWRPIEELPGPDEVRLPLLQHIGAAAEPIVKKGDRVRRGQKIAEALDSGAPLHATISGKVKPIEKHPHPTLATSPAIVIARTDDAEGELEFPEAPDWRTCPIEESLARIREAGIVGLGGAAFPTWRKLTLPRGTVVDILVVNGAECEPYLTADFRVMLEHAREAVEGGLLMARIIGASRVLIGVEADKPRAILALQKALAELPPGIPAHVVPCEARYPQGAERQLVAAVTGRTVPPRALPSAVGVLVQNVATAVAVHDAVRYRRPLLDRVLTVTGPGVRTPRNLRVPVGTLLADVIAFCGGMTDDASRIVAGGPMMGRTLPRLDVPITKGMNGLVVFEGRGTFEDAYGPCIRCGRCLEVCPLALEPDQVSLRVEAGRPLETARFGAPECYECGCCTYVCPAGRPLVQFMQVAKSALRRADGAQV